MSNNIAVAHLHAIYAIYDYHVMPIKLTTTVHISPALSSSITWSCSGITVNRI